MTRGIQPVSNNRKHKSVDKPANGNIKHAASILDRGLFFGNDGGKQTGMISDSQVAKTDDGPPHLGGILGQKTA